jgi:signal transduction histidine kinase
MMRRVGCLFGLLLLIAVATIGLIGWVTGAAIGVVHAPPFAHAIVLIVIVISLFGLFRGARRLGGVAGPVDDLIDAAGRIENGDYTTRIPERGPREVRSVARAFNAMSARLEVTDTRRRTFIADVAHELRTPLAVIEGQVESIVDGVYPADAEHLRPILEQTRALEHLVDDLRTLALTEAGSLPLNREPLDLEQLVTETTAAFAGEAAGAGVNLTVAQAGPGPMPTVSADPARVRQVLVNLLANALRHTPRGGTITVAVAAAATATGTRSVAVSVRDSGPGFPPDVLPRAFERFVRGADSSGTGLGLAIARDLVLAHGGEIVATNPPGGGAEVRFSLPIDATAAGGAARR